MKESLNIWISDEKNFILRFIKRQLFKLLEPLILSQNDYNDNFADKLDKENLRTKELQKKIDELISEYHVLKSKYDSLHTSMTKLRVNERLEDVEKNIRSINNWLGKADQVLFHDDSYSLIDYMDFENYFRGSVDLIKERQSEYLNYFSGCRHIVDIGCGRGEFLTLLKENNINAEGVEIYKPYVDYCRNAGLKVHLESGIDYLNNVSTGSIDGIYMGQVAEHLSVRDLITTIQLAYEKLVNGSYLIMETPNPMTLAIFTHAFYIDPSHNKPVHPYLLQYLAQKAGFHQVSILFLPKSKLPEEFPLIVSTGIENLEEVNSGIEKLSDLLYGYQDYAIIAQKN